MYSSSSSLNTIDLLISYFSSLPSYSIYLSFSTSFSSSFSSLPLYFNSVSKSPEPLTGGVGCFLITNESNVFDGGFLRDGGFTFKAWSVDTEISVSSLSCDICEDDCWLGSIYRLVDDLNSSINPDPKYLTLFGVSPCPSPFPTSSLFENLPFSPLSSS